MRAKRGSCAFVLLRLSAEHYLPGVSKAWHTSRTAGSRRFAQVGEWLKPADCKSAPPSGVRRFESFPVHQSWVVAVRGVPLNRLAMAMVAFAVLGALTWTTIDDEKIRYGATAILALFAMKTWLRRNDAMHPIRATRSSRQR